MQGKQKAEEERGTRPPQPSLLWPICHQLEGTDSAMALYSAALERARRQTHKGLTFDSYLIDSFIQELVKNTNKIKFQVDFYAKMGVGKWGKNKKPLCKKKGIACLQLQTCSRKHFQNRKSIKSNPFPTKVSISTKFNKNTFTETFVASLHFILFLGHAPYGAGNKLVVVGRTGRFFTLVSNSFAQGPSPHPTTGNALLHVQFLLSEIFLTSREKAEAGI